MLRIVQRRRHQSCEDPVVGKSGCASVECKRLFPKRIYEYRKDKTRARLLSWSFDPKVPQHSLDAVKIVMRSTVITGLRIRVTFQTLGLNMSQRYRAENRIISRSEYEPRGMCEAKKVEAVAPSHANEHGAYHDRSISEFGIPRGLLSPVSIDAVGGA